MKSTSSLVALAVLVSWWSSSGLPVIERILSHLALATEAPLVVQARPPPEPSLPFA